MKPLNFITFGASLILCISAFPTSKVGGGLVVSTPVKSLSPTPKATAPLPNTPTPLAPQCPTVNAIAAWLGQNSQIGNNTVFWSSPSTKPQAKTFKETIGGQYWGSVYPDSQFNQWAKDCGPNPIEQEKLELHMSAALGKMSTDTAYIMIAGGVQPKPTSIFMKYEYTGLVQNKAVVWAVDAGTNKVIGKFQP